MITERDVEHIGMLADIAILREELEEFTASFNRILEYFDILDQVTGNEKDEGIAVNVFREDEVVPSLPPEDVLSNAKETEDGFFRAPRVM
jgi:aspartyl-tRNA(Asn)/glutamyl-tRNA(Gln) amidotransferase subunit C